MDAILTLDGQEGFPIEPDDIVSVSASKESVYLPQLSRRISTTYYEPRFITRMNKIRKGFYGGIMKYNRHAKILDIIENYEIETQDELAEKLRESGWM